MASLLETFFILFESDSKDVKRGAEEAGKVVDDLEDKLKDTDVATKDIGKSFLEIMKSSKAAIAAVLGFGGITAAIINSAQQTAQIAHFSRAIGLNMVEVGAWSQAVIRAGGSAEGFQSSISSLTGQLTEFSLTGGGKIGETFARLGIQAFNAGGKIKTAFEVLPELADKFEQMSKAQAVNFGQKLGLDIGTILLLQQGGRSVDELIRKQKELGVATEEDAQAAIEFNIAWQNFVQRAQRGIMDLANIMLPVLENILDSFGDFVQFFKDNEDLISGFFIGVAAAITLKYLPAIIRAGIATFAAMAPFILIASAIAAVGVVVALVYEDIVKFNKGQNSLIGEAIKKWPILGDIIEGVKNSFVSLFDIAGKVFKVIKEIFSGDFSSIIDLFTMPDFLEKFRINMETGKSAFQEAQNNPLSGQTSNSISNANTANRNTSVSVGSVSVDARGGNSEEIAAGVGTALSDQMKQAISDFDDGVAA